MSDLSIGVKAKVYECLKTLGRPADRPGTPGRFVSCMAYYFPKEWKVASKFIDRNCSAERLYQYLHNLDDVPPICINPKCDNRVLFRKFSTGYCKYCSPSCDKSDPNGYNKSISREHNKKLAEKQKTLEDYWESKPFDRKECYASLYRLWTKNPPRPHVWSWVRKHKPHLYYQLTKTLDKKFEAADLFIYCNPDKPRGCIGCGVATRFINIKRGFQKRCRSCGNLNGVETRRKLSLERTSGKYRSSSQRPDVRQRRKQLEMQRSGFVNVSQRPEVRAKISKTRSAPGFYEKCVAAELERSGGLYTHSSQRPDVFEKKFRSQLRTYHVEYKKRLWSLQGYEDIALVLLNKAFRVPITKISNVGMPGFPYKDPVPGRHRVYYPDFVLYDRICVEVKSPYTAKGGNYNRGTVHGLGALEHTKLKAVSSTFEYLLLILEPLAGEKHPKITGNLRNGRLVNYYYSNPTIKKVRPRSDVNILFRGFQKF